MGSNVKVLHDESKRRALSNQERKKSWVYRLCAYVLKLVVKWNLVNTIPTKPGWKSA